MNTENVLLESLAGEFRRGIEIIRKIEDAIYCRKANSTGSIGGHFRHNLDFTNAFLNGFETGKIDYQNRLRDEKIEQNRNYAIEKIEFMISRLQVLADADLERGILIRSEIDEQIWHKSSAARELEFLHSHTVHHHALIAEKLSNSGVKLSTDFGVAPSTLKFWKKFLVPPSGGKTSAIEISANNANTA